MAKKTKNKGGRPTKYKPEYATDEFIAEFVEHCKKEKLLISLCGFAVYIGVCEETLQEWRESKFGFSVPLSKIKQLSKQMLINKGLAGGYNSTITKLMLSSNHGMVEKTELSGDLTVNIKN